MRDVVCTSAKDREKSVMRCEGDERLVRLVRQLLRRQDVNVFRESEEDTPLDLALMIVQEIQEQHADYVEELVAKQRTFWECVRTTRAENINTREHVEGFLMCVVLIWNDLYRHV